MVRELDIIFVVFHCYCNLENDIFGTLGNRFRICMRIGNSFVERKKKIGAVACRTRQQGNEYLII
jgi:hypothetical protein